MGQLGGSRAVVSSAPRLVLSLGCRGRDRGASRVQRVACSRET